MTITPIRLLALCALTLAACDNSRKTPAPVVYRGTQPATEQPPAQPTAQTSDTRSAAPAPAVGREDARGVILYQGYETIRARRGDTVETMAARVGLTGSELAAYNGLATRYQPAAGAELVLPARADRYQTALAAAPAAPPAATPAVRQQPSSPPPAYQPSAPALEDAGRPQPTLAAEAPDATTGWSAAAARAAILGAPATAQEPAPAPALLVSPQPVQVAAAPMEDAAQVPTATAGRFLRPADAAIARPFSRAPGPGRNDGVDFSTNAGDPVRAADSGRVALISKSLGGLGTIVLIRHDNQYLSVYGRVAGVTVRKGDAVQRGQVIAEVANLEPPRDPFLHFEIREGAESVDPASLF